MPTLDARAEPIERVVEECAREVFAGGTIVLPSDTGYCLACDPYRSEAVDRIYVIQGRPDHKPLTLLVASAAEFLEYAPQNPLAILASKRLLPGPLRLIVRRPAFVSDDVAAGAMTLSLRVPDESVARAILERTGPLAATSVPDTKTPADLAIENGPARYDRESTIVDLTGRYARLVREGAVSYERLTQLLGPVERPTVKVRSQS
ncbi:MAG TPA: L-threonylcarbamoyladenylate synthase [Alphaproteobacteria bacterium]|nr:L-threonylcarbamoyladenylate synthase [Alphaproteobacteria bacterium]